MADTPCTCYLVDLDDTVVEHGTQNFLPGAREKVQALCEQGAVFFFSCWAFDRKDIDFLTGNFPKAQGFIQKPPADRYVFIDDKCIPSECRTAL